MGIQPNLFNCYKLSFLYANTYLTKMIIHDNASSRSKSLRWKFDKAQEAIEKSNEKGKNP